MTPNRNIAITSLALSTAVMTVCIPLFKPRCSSFNLNKTVTTTLGDIAVTTNLLKIFYVSMMMFNTDKIHFLML